jgi:hypothetical protein
LVFSDALGLAAAHGLVFIGVHASSIGVVGETPELAISAALGLAALPLRSAWPLRLASEYGKQGQGVHVPGGNFTRWPVRGAGVAMARELGLHTGAHDAPKVFMF